MKVIKSIFDKSYMTANQAATAAHKALGLDADQEYRIEKREIDGRWVVIAPVATEVAGKPYLVIGGGQYAWACEDADIKVYGNTEVEALEAYKNQLAFEADLKAPAKFQALVADAAAAIEEFGEDELERFADEQRAAARKANASMGLPEAKPRFSSCVRPTKKVWDIADCMAKASRKEVMEECVRQGVAYGTARTQYQAWFKASQEALRGDIRQPYEKGEK